MNYFWVCSECGSANVYPEDKFCEVCNKEIDEEEKKRTTIIIQADRYDDRKNKLFQKYENDNLISTKKYDANLYTNTIQLSNTYQIIDEQNWIVGSKAFDLTNNRYVLLRSFSIEERDETIKRRIRNRFKKLAPLQHKAMAKTFDIHMESAHVWIAEELIEYVTLDEFIQTLGIVKCDDAIIIAIQILELLCFWQENGFIHGNLNTKNIRITPNNNIVITGLFIPFSKSLLTTYENYCVSPEQIENENDAPSSDIYSVGALLYKMLNGRYPNQHGNATFAFCKNARIGINKDLPFGLEQIVLHAINVCVDDRYETANEMLDDLKSLDMDRTTTFNFNTRARPSKADTKDKKKTSIFLRKIFK